jgi:hypothetical protein
MRFAILPFFILLVGCGQQVGRYQIVAAEGKFPTVWRLDTVTGEITRCNYARATNQTICGVPEP